MESLVACSLHSSEPGLAPELEPVSSMEPELAEQLEWAVPEQLELEPARPPQLQPVVAHGDVRLGPADERAAVRTTVSAARPSRVVACAAASEPASAEHLVVQQAVLQEPQGVLEASDVLDTGHQARRRSCAVDGSQGAAASFRVVDSSGSWGPCAVGMLLVAGLRVVVEGHQGVLDHFLQECESQN